jgi:hypothetical protein
VTNQYERRDTRMQLGPTVVLGQQVNRLYTGAKAIGEEEKDEEGDGGVRQYLPDRKHRGGS